MVRDIILNKVQIIERCLERVKHRKLPGQMIICFLLMGFIASFLSGCGSHTKEEEAPDAVTLTSMGESGESDLINEKEITWSDTEGRFRCVIFPHML